MKTLHLLLATVEDPQDPSSWSGTPFHMRQALEQRFARVSVLSSPKPKRSLGAGLQRLLRGPKHYPLWLSPAALQDYARQLEQRIAQDRPDAVLCISSQHLVHARAQAVPVFMVSDAPWMAFKEAYRDYDVLPLRATHYAQLEAAAAKAITGVIYPTPWACAEAQARFGLSADKVARIALGANRFCSADASQVQARVRRKAASPMRFLFVGKDWERKGGPAALHIVRQLNQSGCPSRLVIIGCTPQIAPDDAAHVVVHGFLSPTRPDQLRSLQAAFEQAHFFLVPSRAECFGLVYAEAQSYGLPCIALASHGIPGVVEHAVTGLLFEPACAVSAMVDQILALARNRAAYEQMALAARHKFDAELNWGAFGQRTHQAIAQACAAAQARHAA